MGMRVRHLIVGKLGHEEPGLARERDGDGVTPDSFARVPVHLGQRKNFGSPGSPMGANTAMQPKLVGQGFSVLVPASGTKTWPVNGFTVIRSG
jgi:hypothetical protein